MNGGGVLGRHALYGKLERRCAAPEDIVQDPLPCVAMPAAWIAVHEERNALPW